MNMLPSAVRPSTACSTLLPSPLAASVSRRRVTALARRTSPAARQAVWPVLIVLGFVVAQYPQKVGLIPDEGAVQEFAAASTDPAFGDRAYAGRPHVVACSITVRT
jgi:hypothetical protein